MAEKMEMPKEFWIGLAVNPSIEQIIVIHFSPTKEEAEKWDSDDSQEGYHIRAFNFLDTDSAKHQIPDWFRSIGVLEADIGPALRVLGRGVAEHLRG